jgi:LPXTG-site transpeptidase (sortase) family protein
MKAPGDITEVGWYKYGPLPGNTGSAVLAGHVNGPNGRPGVFSKLNTLQVGDEFTVIDSTQQDTKFVVRATRTYSQDEQPIEVFADQVGARLNLITCTGSWDKEQRRYSERLVVFTEAIQ